MRKRHTRRDVPKRTNNCATTRKSNTYRAGTDTKYRTYFCCLDFRNFLLIGLCCKPTKTCTSPSMTSQTCIAHPLESPAILQRRCRSSGCSFQASPSRDGCFQGNLIVLQRRCCPACLRGERLALCSAPTTNSARSNRLFQACCRNRNKELEGLARYRDAASSAGQCIHPMLCSVVPTVPGWDPPLLWWW